MANPEKICLTLDIQRRWIIPVREVHSYVYKQGDRQGMWVRGRACV